MGFGSWLARKGSVGGTARAVAKGWKTIKEKNPGMSPKEIAEAYVTVRYLVTNEQDLAIRVLTNLRVNTRKREPNPLDLSWAIFWEESVKAGDSLTVLEHRVEWRQIMKEEIEKMGIAAGR
jgi:hypothetical protein